MVSLLLSKETEGVKSLRTGYQTTNLYESSVCVCVSFVCVCFYVTERCCEELQSQHTSINTSIGSDPWSQPSPAIGPDRRTVSGTVSSRRTSGRTSRESSLSTPVGVTVNWDPTKWSKRTDRRQSPFRRVSERPSLAQKKPTCTNSIWE